MALAPKLRLPSLVACLVCALAVPAAADPTAWNQAAVTEIAAQLSDAGNAWQTALFEQTAAAPMSDRMMDLQNQTRIIRDKSLALSAKVKKGKPRDEVVGEYMSLRETVDLTKDTLKYVELEKPAQDAWAKYDATLAKLTPYFDAKGGN
jgi:hypothetical protein